jgi:intracellular multiplication protein IcmK
MCGCLSKAERQVGFASKQKEKRFMNKLKSIAIVVCLLPLMAGLIWAESCSASDAAGQQVRVLGQPDIPPENQAGDAKKESGSAQKKGAPADNQKPDAQTLFQESLRQMMPLEEGQIQEYRERSDQRERALLPVSPALASRTARVSLEPGNAPVKVYTTANVATSLVFHDSTGQPWPITSVTNGGPSFFQVLRPELPDGNLLNVMPIQGYGTSTIVVTLEKQDIPLVIRLESDSVRAPERKADALVLFQLAHYGPKAALPIIEDIKETVDSSMLAFLDHVPPAKAVRLSIEPATDKLTVWKFNDHHYIRTNHTLMWPAWIAVVNGAGNVKCYEAPVTSRIMISNNGRMQTVILKDAARRNGEAQ